MFHQLLAQHGVVVWVLDNRSASGKGAESQWPVYGRLGELELQDLEDGISWLKQQPFVDPSRIVLQRLELRRLHDRRTRSRTARAGRQASSARP